MANFVCPDCAAGGSLTIIASIVLPPDSRSDDIVLQIARCGRCAFRGAAVYEESRRGNLDSESWDHRGYRLGRQELAELNRLISACPAKKNKRCSCPSHRQLGRKNDTGRWLMPFEVDWKQSFPMRRS